MQLVRQLGIWRYAIEVKQLARIVLLIFSVVSVEAWSQTGICPAPEQQCQAPVAERRLTKVANQSEIDELTFAQITGLALDQQFELMDKPSPARLGRREPIFAYCQPPPRAL